MCANIYSKNRNIYLYIYILYTQFYSDFVIAGTANFRNGCAIPHLTDFFLFCEKKKIFSIVFFMRRARCRPFLIF